MTGTASEKNSATHWNSLPTQINLAEIDRSVLSFWKHEKVFARSVSEREGADTWTFYEGPPTANGMPGTHHVEARVFKDVFPRFHTMKGRHVIRKAGWDCHGLPVELAVEKELGFTGKGDIEKYGVAPFNDKCRESVQRHVGAFEEMTTRMGFWVDFDAAYWTMSPEYVESVWWSLQQIWKKGLLVQDHRVAPYCPRCGTGLSDHELAQGYETITDPSVFVRFPITEGKYEGVSLLVWTTTPWTLVSNTAIAVNPKVTYVVASDESGEKFIVAQPLLSVLGDDIKVLESVQGSALEHTKYSRPFDWVEIPDAHYVVLAEYVTTEDGTGLVHQSPAFGADDLAVCRAYGLPVVNPVRADGTFEIEIPLVGGEFFKTADKALVKELKAQGLLFRQQQYEHSYPHCWRCHTPLMYYAQPSWYIRTTAIKDALISENEKTDWHPETIRSGRYGDWLNNNIDWAVSRNRYWGTPLPIWRCEEGHLECFGSLAELGTRAGEDLSALDPHRPFVDDVTFPCEQCAGEMNRVPEVIDCWYDSGAMPFAQWGYPHKEGSIEKFNAAYPADFICEAIDQTRGWFYTLMAIGTLVFEKSSYKTVLCLGHILDKDGRKMSKHVGNVLEPISLMDEHGADAVRWFMLAAGSPWQSRRVGHDAITEVVRKTLLTYWNTVSFLSLYARIAKFDAIKPIPVEDRSTLDHWIISELNSMIYTVDKSLTDFDSQGAGRAIASFIDNLSNWYVRRSRRRFWDGDPAALATLFECLRDLTLVMAPMVPFITEHVWQQLVRPADSHAALSVHLADFPKVRHDLIDQSLIAQVSQVRRLVELGRAARAESNIKIRQPLGRALISAAGWRALSEELRNEIADELNVLHLDDISEVDVVDLTLKPNFRTLGIRFGKETATVAAEVAAVDATSLVLTLRKNGKTSVGDREIFLEDVVITETPRSGWTYASDSGESVALDLTITPELRSAGIMREIIRSVQDARKSSGFEVSDRILVRWSGESSLDQVIKDHGAEIMHEVLALELEREEGEHPHQNEDVGMRFSVIKAH